MTTMAVERKRELFSLLFLFEIERKRSIGFCVFVGKGGFLRKRERSNALFLIERF